MEELTAYCVRECILETGGSEECDDSCRCVAQKLSREYSKSDFTNLVQSLIHTRSDSADSSLKLKNAMKSCRDLGN